MARFACPYCNRYAKLPHYVVRADILCAGCHRVFSAGDASPLFERKGTGGRLVGVAPVPEPVPPPEPPAPQLTAEHHCQHCAAPLRSPTGLPRATVPCPACGNKTSVYAVLHRCPDCGRLLESPSRSAGREAAYPACGHRSRVPKDVLLAEPPTDPDDFWFGCFCQGCGGEVAARARDAGAYAVCPHCHVPLDVPHAGHYLRNRAPPPQDDPLAALHACKNVPCPRCGTPIPSRAGGCPACGAGIHP